MSELEPTRTYSNPTATDELRRLLDERGVEWASSHEWEGRTFWPNNDGINAISTDWGKGLLVHAVMTPAQAVDATLGRGTCHRKWRKDGYAFCSECGYNITGPWAHWCPNCGRKVEQ